MSNFDEYEQGSLPPDAPSNAEAIELIQNAAESDPAFKTFLDTWFPSVPSVYQGPSSALQPTLAATSDVRTQAIDQVESDGHIHASDNQERVHQLERKAYHDLISQSITNYDFYQRKRQDAQITLLQECLQELSLPLHESEDIFNAVHFDIQAGKQIDLDRILKHKNSVRASMAHVLSRETLNIEEQCSSLSTVEDDSLERLQYEIKAEIVQNSKIVEELNSQIKSLQRCRPEDRPMKQTNAIENVYLRLLTILDELVPQTDSTDVDQASKHSKDALERHHSEVQVATDQLDSSLARLRALTAASAERTTCQSIAPPQNVWKLDSSRSEAADELTTRPLDVLQGRPSTQDLMASFAKIRKLEDRLKADQVRSQTTEIQNSHVKSQQLLQEFFAKRSMETPLLANKDLYGVKDSRILSQSWKQASEERALVTERSFEEKTRLLSQRLDLVESTLEMRMQILQNVQQTAEIHGL